MSFEEHKEAAKEALSSMRQEIKKGRCFRFGGETWVADDDGGLTDISGFRIHPDGAELLQLEPIVPPRCYQGQVVEFEGWRGIVSSVFAYGKADVLFLDGTLRTVKESELVPWFPKFAVGDRVLDDRDQGAVADADVDRADEVLHRGCEGVR